MIICHRCGAHLDPGERCDCERWECEQRASHKRKQNQEAYRQAMEEFEYA